MSIFTPDTSIQLSGNSGVSKTYNTKDNPNLAFHSRAGIYNSADNEIKIFTNNIDALTIDANQKVICNGSLITNLAWGNINGKPTNFQSDWNSTIINKPSLFDGTWNSLSGKPTNFQSDWNSTIINKPDALVNVSNIFPTSNVIINSTNLINYNNLSSKPNLSSVATSGNYNDLINKTFINNGNDIYNNNIGNVGIGITNPTSKLHLRGNFTHDYALSTNLTSFGNLIANKRPWGVYFAEDWSGTTLPDSSGNGRDATTSGTITKTTASGNGASGAITYISGGTTATISFPTGSIPTAFTILALTRYNGGTRQRIIQSRTSGINWSLGHLSGLRGLAYFVNNYYTDGAGIAGSQDDWLTSIAKSSGTIPTNILMNGIQRGAGTPNTTGGYELGVNLGITAQVSDWALSCVMIWDSALTDAEMVLLNTTIENYKSTGNSLNYELSKTFFLSEVYSLNNLYFNRELFKNNTNISNIFITSNVHSNSSNYLYNQIITSGTGNVSLTNYFDKTETSNIFPTSNVIKNSTNLINYNNLTNKPTNFQSDWLSTIINRPDALVNISNVFPTSNVIQNTQDLINYTKLAGKPTLFDGTWTSLSGKPTNFQSDWNSTVINKPSIPDGNYNNLTNKPFINSGTDIYNNNTGNVGIGLTSPQQKLSVVGTIESTNGNAYKAIFSYDNANGYRHAIYTNHDGGSGDNNYIQFYNWRYGQASTTAGDKSVAIFHNKYTRFDGNRYFWINDVNSVITGYDHSTAPLTLFHKTATSASVLNDSLPILNLAREGTGGQAWGARANFNICRWEHAGASSVGSRTRLDLNLAHDAYDNINIMTWRSDGRVGINTTTPVSRFTIRGDYSTIDNNFCLDATDTAGVNNKYNLKIYPYVIGAGQIGYKIRVVNNIATITDALTFSDVGNVCIGNITPSYKLQIEDGTVFIGDSAYVSAGLGTANGYKLIFDNTYNSAVGSGNICNKILLHNTASFNAGFGIETGALVYQSGDSHSFYTGTTASSYGTRRMLLSSTGNLNINTNDNSYVKLQVSGVVNFHAGGTPYASLNNNMIAGSLCIGDRTYDYGGGSGWNTNVAGLLLECANNTEIAVHDNGERVASLINFAGSNNNYHEYGRNMGWGHPNAHYFKCNQMFECYHANAVGSWNFFRVEPTSLWGDGLSTASDQGGTKYLTMRNLMFQNPHIVPHTVGGNAHIRMGRAGGVASGHFWDVATRTDGRFHIVRNGDVFSSSMVIKPNGNVSFGNQNSYDDPSAPNSYQFLHLGNSTTANVCDWNLVIHKSNGSGGNRHFAMGYDSSWYETIGDNGANNTGSGNWLSHLSMAYSAPDYSLQLLSTGNFIVYGTISSGSDIKIKKNVRTIDNALWKVQQLRGVYYTHVIEETKNIGLIAQEVEGIIPEVVNYNERTDMKGVNYANLTALLINAIKEQQEIINTQNDRISKIEEILYNLMNK